MNRLRDRPIDKLMVDAALAGAGVVAGLAVAGAEGMRSFN